MLQILLGTVYWQREKGSCMFCKCNKREGVIDNQTHNICTTITDAEHLKLYNKARGMYKTMYANHTDDLGETNEKECSSNYMSGLVILILGSQILLKKAINHQ